VGGACPGLLTGWGTPHRPTCVRSGYPLQGTSRRGYPPFSGTVFTSESTFFVCSILADRPHPPPIFLEGGCLPGTLDGWGTPYLPTFVRTGYPFQGTQRGTPLLFSSMGLRRRLNSGHRPKWRPGGFHERVPLPPTNLWGGGCRSRSLGGVGVPPTSRHLSERGTPPRYPKGHPLSMLMINYTLLVEITSPPGCRGF
jgi:hypothetical protein